MKKINDEMQYKDVFDTINDNFDEANPDSTNFVNAWSWSADGTDRFTKVYPGENLVDRTKTVQGYVFATDGSIAPPSAYNNELTTDYLPVYQGQAMYMQLRVTVEGPGQTNQGWYGIGYYDENKVFINRVVNLSQATPVGTEIYFEARLTVPANARFMRVSWRNFSGAKVKVEKGNTPTIYTPAPSEDPINAYPKYKGQRLAPSDNPDDYDWSYTDEYADYLREKQVTDHVTDLGNPHKVTAAQTGAFTKQESSDNVIALLDERNLTNAWSWSADGTDRFTKVYPRENLVNIRTTNLTSTNIATVPIRNEMLTENGISFVRAIRTNPTLNPTVFSIYTSFLLDRELDKDISGKKVELSFMARASRPTKFTMMAVLAKPDVNLSENGKQLDITTEWKQYGFVQDNFPSYTEETLFRLNPWQTIGLNNVDGFYLDYRDVKISIIDDDNDTITIYTTPPSKDPINAYPTYKGQRLAESNDPADYDWQYADEYVDYLIANNHVENLATSEEAKAGTDTTKTMTPATTAQSIDNRAVTLASNQTIGGIKNFKDGLMINDISLSTITRKVIYEGDGVGGYFNQSDKFTLGPSGKIDRVVMLWSRVDDVGGTLLNYSWSQTVLSPDDIILGYSYRLQLTNENYKFVNFANESGNVTISGANENSVAPNRIYRIKRIIAYLKN